MGNQHGEVQELLPFYGFNYRMNLFPRSLIESGKHPVVIIKFKSGAPNLSETLL